MPRLRLISVNNIDFGAFASDIPEFCLPFHECLLDLLTRRENSGVPLEELRIGSCDIMEDWHEELEDVVYVEWDGEQGDYATPPPEEEDSYMCDTIDGWY
ncbi:hypothetical protein OF83DRAFT_855474 [Amylostereum chailletii]|nr:hypothetical protein OF83DRAFT_855474 [Amylostereum chailletii]